MRVEYAIRLYDCLGQARYWADAYTRIEMARRDIRHLLKARPLGFSAEILKRTTPTGQIGAQWEIVRMIRS